MKTGVVLFNIGGAFVVPMEPKESLQCTPIMNHLMEIATKQVVCFVGKENARFIGPLHEIERLDYWRKKDEIQRQRNGKSCTSRRRYI